MEAVMSDGQSTVEYRPIKDFPGYRVGSDGSCWSCRTMGRNSFVSSQWKRLKASPDFAGYPVVVLCPNLLRCYVHRLVLEAFVGPCPEGMQCCHGDGNPANNRLDNLRWGTLAENRDDSRRHGTLARGVRITVAKLTDEKVRAMRAEYAAGGITQRALARKHGVCQHVVMSAINRLTWKHVTDRDA